MTNNPAKTNASSNFVDNENGHFHFFGQFWTLRSFLADWTSFFRFLVFDTLVAAVILIVLSGRSSCADA